MNEIKEKRRELCNKLFPQGMPKLWCPPLTHYSEDGKIDFPRIKKHMGYLIPHINSFLIPGSTGDGWEITYEEYQQLLEFVFEELAKEYKINVLIGLLRTDTKGVIRFLDYAERFFKEKGTEILAENYQESCFKGFVICPPKGAEISLEAIKSEIELIIRKGYPMVLYQLPQVTENEMSPEMVEYLAQNYFNCYMLKDSSGKDVIAKAKYDYENLVLLRGAEGDYVQMLKEVGGNYDGFLLSTGNSFPKELAQIMYYLTNGEKKKAEELSNKLTSAVNEVFKLAAEIPYGNTFTNSNKLIDHLNAYGKEWKNYSAPKLHSGVYLAKEMLEKVEKILKKNGLFKEKGYLLG
ncbi:MAG: dihydrodipicolinate synthase family protein [Candidatus Heimdallarchaeaceae archaeon]